MAADDLYRDISTASLTDALGRLTDTPLHVLDLVSPTPGRVLRGRVATIRFVPFREDAFDPEQNSIASFFYQALPEDPSETVLVLDSGGTDGVSLGGGVKYSRVHNWGLAGLITSARLRDFAELATYHPVFYAAAETIKAGAARVMPIAANVPVVLGGVTVLPGDWIHADQAGTVVIPATLLDQTYRLAAEIDEAEVTAALRIREETRPSISRGSRLPGMTRWPAGRGSSDRDTEPAEPSAPKRSPTISPTADHSGAP